MELQSRKVATLDGEPQNWWEIVRAANQLGYKQNDVSNNNTKAGAVAFLKNKGFRVELLTK